MSEQVDFNMFEDPVIDGQTRISFVSPEKVIQKNYIYLRSS